MLPTVDLPPLASNTPLWLALLTTGVAAVEGAVVARQRNEHNTPMDMVGVFVMALFLGLGGALARDLLLGNTPVVAIRTPWYIVVVALATLLVLAAGRYIPAIDSPAFILLDALTLGLYSAVGVQYALAFGVSVLGAMLVGLFAGLTGAAIVSILRQETPSFMQPNWPYGLLAVAGLCAYLVLVRVSEGLAVLACVAVVVILRFVTLKWNIRTKDVTAVDDSPA